MRIDPEYPYSEIYDRAYLAYLKGKVKIIVLYNTHGKRRSTTTYARYLMSVKLGRFLTKSERVDHIDGDLSNDSIENLQLAPPTVMKHGSRAMYRSGCRCELCCEKHTEEQRKWRRTYYKKWRRIYNMKRKEEKVKEKN